MLRTTRTVAPGAELIVALCACLWPLPHQESDSVESERDVELQSSPPGLVLVPGASVELGTDRRRLEDLIRESPQLAPFFGAESPPTTVRVAPFLLMPREVTVEQYAEYVTATGARPPEDWGREAIDRARGQFLHEPDRADSPSKKTFSARDWWYANWQDVQWEVPSGASAAGLASAVRYVDYADVVVYARWAGLRPMTESEFQRAVAWCESEPEERLHDLVGGLWEWTSTPYLALDGFETFTVEVGSGRQEREVKADPRFDANQRVAKGGYSKGDASGLRAATRYGLDRSQTAAGVGLRCAASLRPGQDTARAILEQDLRLSVLPESARDGELAPARVVARTRWSSRASTVEELRDDPATNRVITGHDFLLFTPAAALPVTNLEALSRHVEDEGPVLLGFLSSSRPIVEPALEAGTYYVLWRGPLEEESAPQLVYLDLAGEPVAQQEARKPSRVKPGMEGVLEITAAELPDPPIEPDALHGDSLPRNGPGDVPDTATFTFAVPGKRGRRGFGFELSVRVDPGSF